MRRSAFGFDDGTPRPDQVTVGCDGCDETLLVGEETARAHAEGDAPIRCDDCRAALPFRKGDDVEVTGLDGETGSARVVAVLDATAGDHVLFEDGDSVTVADYWGRTVGEDELVVRVRYTHTDPEDGRTVASGKPYDFPESAVESAEDADDGDEGGEA